MQLPQTYRYALLVLASSLATLSASAQKPAEGVKNMLQQKDSVSLLQGVSVGYDLAGTVMRLVGDYGQYEASLRLNLKDKYFPIVELGLGEAKHDTDPVTGIALKTSAPYGRIGCDFNVAKNKHDDYRVLAGARYGFTSFKQEVDGMVKDPVWGYDVNYEMPAENYTYHWAELVFGLDAKLWGPVRLGWSFRYKLKLSSKEIDGEELWYVPGYGRDGDKLGGVFYVSVELHRKKK